jgi:hypothetical protein
LHRIVEEIDVSERAAVRTPVRGRVVAVVALGAVAIGMLSACRSTFTQPGAAAFVGNTTVSQSTVNETAASIPAAAKVSTSTGRTESVTALTFNQLAALYAKDKGYPVARPTTDIISGLGTQLQITDATKAADNKFVQAYSQRAAWLGELITKVTPVTPTDLELRDVYEDVVASGAQVGAYNDVKAQVAALPGIGSALALRRDLLVAEKQFNLQVNPLYQSTCLKAPCASLEIPLLYISDGNGGEIPAVYLPLTVSTDPAVLDSAQ